MADLTRPMHSLTGRVLSAVLLILLLGGVLVAGWTWANGRAAARQTYDRLLIGAASDIAESIRIQAGRAVVDLPVSAFELLAQAPDERVFYAVRGPNGALLTGFDGGPDATGAGSRIALQRFFDGALQTDPARFVTVTRRFAERDFSGNVSVTVGQTVGARQAMVVDLMLDALVPLAVAGAALVLIAYVVIRSAVRPLGALSSDLAGRDPNDLTPVQVAGLPSELRVTLEAMNRFMQRLDNQVSGMRTLISDTAHQLRTPVAAIRAQAEAMEGANGAERDRMMSRLLARTRSLGDLLDQLLSRALVVHRGDSAPRVAFDLREVALDLIERRDHELLAPGAEVRLELGEDEVIVWADQFSVGQAARNLLINALRHGAAPVVVGVSQHGGDAALWVQDAGPGAPHSVQVALGARFERSARSPEDSTGLGLSIVAAVARAFGGRVEMAQTGAGFRVSLLLPRVEGAA